MYLPEIVGKTGAERITGMTQRTRALHFVFDSLAGGAVTARVVPVLAGVQAPVASAHLVRLALGVGGAARLAQSVDADPSFAALVVAAADAGAPPSPAHLVGQAVGLGGRALGHAEAGVAGG